MSSTPSLPMKRVLLVDDETAVIHVTKRMLEIGGYAVTPVTTAAEALRLVESQPLDLVITDRWMPGMDGEEMAALIKERSPQLPILMITGFPDSVIRREHFVAILQKPFASAELLSHVGRALGREA